MNLILYVLYVVVVVFVATAALYGLITMVGPWAAAVLLVMIVILF